MSWTNIKNTGNGRLEFRVKIEGLDYEFVTNSRMVQDKIDFGPGPGVTTAPAGRVKRRLGLKREGLSISEEVILPENRLDLNGNSFTIIDDHEYSATAAFFRRPTIQGNLVINISRTANNMAVTNGRGLAVGDYIWIGTEALRLTSVGSVPTSTGNWLITAQRGRLGTTPQTHFVRTEQGELLRPAFQNCPFGIEARRVVLYAYGEGDDLQGNGTAVWRGIVTQEASTQDGVVWRFEAGPITELLKAELGNSFEDVKFRGIYFSKREWQIEFQRLDGPRFIGSAGGWGWSGVSASNPSGSIIACTGSGFYETKWDLASDLNRQLVTASRNRWSDSSTQMGCTVIDGELVFTYTTTTSPKAVTALARDGIRRMTTFTSDTDQPLMPWQTIGQQWEIRGGGDPSAGEFTYTFVDGARIGWQVLANKTIAIRTVEPLPDIVAPYYSGVRPISGFRNPQRMHLAIDQLANGVTDVKVYKTNVQEGETGTGGANREDDIEISRRMGESSAPNPVTVDLTNRTITTNMFGNFIATSEDYYMILGNRLNRSAGHVVKFVEALVSQSADLCTQGFCPLLTTEDFDLRDMATVISGVQMNNFINRRIYSFYKKGRKLEEILQNEYKLIGCYPALTQEGKMTIRPFRQVTPSERLDHYINEDDTLTDESFMSLEPNVYGIWNSISLATKYDAVADEHLGDTFVANNFDSIARNNGKKKTIECTPFSYEDTQLILVAEHIGSFLAREVGLLSEKYYVTNVEVPMTFFSSAIGDSVQIINRQIPNPYVGSIRRRGNALLSGIIVGRTFDLDRGFGTLKIFLSNEQIFGEISVVGVAAYTPGVIAPTGSVSGSTVVVTLTPEEKQRAFGSDLIDDHLPPGTRVRFETFDSFSDSSSGVGTVGTITSSGDTYYVSVSFAGGGDIPAALFSAGTEWQMTFPPYTAMTGTFSASMSQSQYSIIDSGSYTLATASGQSMWEGYAGGHHRFLFGI